MFNDENLRCLTPSAKNGRRLWWFYNADNDDVTTSGYFKNISLKVGDCVQVLYGSNFYIYTVSEAVGNDKTVEATTINA